ncbi:hypothetical protein PanWU01x14_117830 [Parasponia andersonii]|uniref:Uncharacterized protein n=1 Tax=Parasponia andersonii TaxID=3476 RepID=A0A2P5CW64_PARAD|nr:hypothetical protein PanWU01x14_117830 [Parasponia andersonii]
MCVCVLRELQWPLVRDAPVFRVGLRTFVFAMPGLLYGLQFHASCRTDVMDTLERVFLKFGYYKDLNESGAGYNLQDNEPQFWQRVRPQIELLAHQTLSKLGHTPGRRLPSIITNTMDFHYSGLLRALRMSSTAKMIGQAILSHSVKAIHFNIVNPKSTMRTPTSNDGKLRNDDDHPTYYASVNVFTHLVDAVEVAWKVAFGDSSDHDDHQQFLQKSNHVDLVDQKLKGLRAWRWTKQGIIDLMKELKSSDTNDDQKKNEKNSMTSTNRGVMNKRKTMS